MQRLLTSRPVSKRMVPVPNAPLSMTADALKAVGSDMCLLCAQPNRLDGATNVRHEHRRAALSSSACRPSIEAAGTSSTGARRRRSGGHYQRPAVMVAANSVTLRMRAGTWVALVLLQWVTGVTVRKGGGVVHHYPWTSPRPPACCGDRLPQLPIAARPAPATGQ